jgi:hypothetical protein
LENQVFEKGVQQELPGFAHGEHIDCKQGEGGLRHGGGELTGEDKMKGPVGETLSFK